jgi:SAM-dependent methyltransferase
MFRLFYQMLDTPFGYWFTQLFGRPTISRYRLLVRTYIPQAPERRLLEVGCGIGNSRGWFVGDYTGVDINPDYIERARREIGGNFLVMNAGEMTFEPGTFDDVVSIATGHHLTDDQLGSMVDSALVVAGSLHLIDSILPISPNHRFKRWLFQKDRGRYVRTFDELQALVGRHAHIDTYKLVQGPLHDVCYIRASRGDSPPTCDTP